jgi:hypothetical protein
MIQFRTGLPALVSDLVFYLTGKNMVIVSIYFIHIINRTIMKMKIFNKHIKVRLLLS